MRERSIPQRWRAGTLVLTAAWSVVLTGQAGLGLSAALGQSLSRQEREFVDRLRAETIRDATVALAGPEMEGRGTAQPGGVKAAKYIADRFAKLGLEPLGDKGSYLQAVPFEASADVHGSSLKIAGTTLKEGEDYRYWIRPSSLSSRGTDARGKAVFVSYAVVVESLDREDPTGLDLKGKIAVDPGGPPKGSEAAARLPYSPARVVSGLARCGVVGVLVIAGSDSRGVPPDPSVAQERRRVFLAGTRRPAPAESPPVAFISRDAAKRLLAKSPDAFADLVGKAEAVVYSAHYDAWGKDKDYHQPSDVVRPEWDWQGVRMAAVFYLVTGLHVANAEKMPEWLPGSRFSRGRGVEKKTEDRR